MCRKNVLHGSCILVFGLGLMVGRSISSWLLCFCGGLALMALGVWVTRRR